MVSLSKRHELGANYRECLPCDFHGLVFILSTAQGQQAGGWLSLPLSILRTFPVCDLSN